MAGQGQQLRPTNGDWSLGRSRPALWLSADRNIGTVGARRFTAADQHRFELASKIEPGTQDFWISLWVYPTSTPTVTNGWLVSGASGASSYGFWTRMSSARKPYVAINVQSVGSQQGTTFDTVLTLNTWTHIVFAFDRDGLLKCYVNGVEDTTSADISAYAGTMGASYAATYIGASGSYYMDGSISRVCYGAGTLPTEDDIAELYNQGNGKFYAELSAALAAKVTHYWNLNEGSMTDPAYDACGTNDGTFAAAELLSNTGFETAGTNGGTAYGISTSTRARSSNVATIVTSSNHGLTTGNVATISGMTDSSYNATSVTVTRVDDTTFTYANTGDNEGVTADTAGRVFTDLFANWTEYAPNGTGQIHNEPSVVQAGSHAAKAVVDASADTVQLHQSGLTTVGNSYTYSAYARGATGGEILRFADQGSVLATHTLDTTYTQYNSTVVATGTLCGFRFTGASDTIYLDTVSCKSAGIPPTSGPREATAADLVGGYHGVLTSMDTINAWKTDTPDGSYTVTKEDSVGSVDGTMTGFADVDAAHVDGPDGHWGPHIPNDGSGGTAYDGWIVGRVTDSRTNNVPAAAGVDAALRTNGTSQYVSKDNQDFAGAFTFAAWIYLDDLSANATIVGDTADTNADGIRVNATTGHVSITVGGSNTVLTTTGLSAGAWKHVAVTRAATTNALKVYVDGTDDTSGTPSQAGTLGFNCIGATHSTPTAFFDGNIASVKVYDSELSAANVALLAAGTAVGSPVGDWRFDDALSLPYLSGCKAIRFDGTDDMITCGTTSEGTTAFTAMCWIRTSFTPTASNEYAFMRYRTDTNQRKWVFRINQTTGTLTVLVSTNGSDAADAGTSDRSLCDGQWHHVAWTWSAGTQNLYIDGVLEDAAAVGSIYNATANLTFGCTDAGSSSLFLGDVADGRLYNAVLTQAQIRSIISGTDYSTNEINEWKFGETPRSIAACADGYSLEFDGTDDVVTLDKQLWNAGIDMGVAPKTISMWIKMLDMSAHQCFLAFYDSTISYGRVEFIVKSTGELFFFCIGGLASDVQSAAGLIELGQWHHVAVSYEDGSQILYCDGVAVDTAAVVLSAGKISSDNIDGPVDIGADRDSGDTYYSFVNARIDDVRFYNSVLSPTDIALLAAGDEPATAPTAHWTMDDGPQYGEPSDGDPVTVWQDRGTSKVNFAQATAGYRPTYDQVASHGLPALAFADQYLTYAGKLLNQVHGHVFIVFRQTAAAQDSLLSMADVGESDELLSFGCQASDGLEYRQNIHSGTEDRLTGATAVAGAWHLGEFSSDGSLIRARVDNTLQTLTAATGANSGDWGANVSNIDNTVVGGLVTSAGLVNGFTGAIAEIIAYDRPLSATEAARVRTRLANKYAITIS